MSDQDLIPNDDPELRTLMTEIKALETQIVLSRTTWARNHGLSYGGDRDEFEILGYDDILSAEQYRSAYERGGLMGRVIDVMPDATWRGDPAMEVIEDEDPQKETPFETAWYELEKKHQINSKLLRVDKLSRLSTYAVILIGAPGSLEEEIPKGKPEQLLYLMPFLGGGGPGGNNQGSRTVSAGADATVFEYENDASNPRFGLPKTYTLKRVDVSSPVLHRPVHWSRIIHVAEGLLDDEVFGQPALARVWNLFADLRKVTGGGAEAFWLRANAGLHLDLDKDMQLPDAAATVASLKEQMKAYRHQLTRALRTRGVKVTQLGSDVANFGPPADAIITQIAGAKAIPKRILTGSEMGELASSQDRENFRDQVIGRQMQYAGPYIARPLVDRLIKYGYLPTPSKGPDQYQIKWPHIQVLTEQEKVTGAQGWASVNQTQGEVVFTDAEIRDKWAGYEPLTDEQRKEIDDRAQEKMEKQQKAMAATAPPEDKPKVSPAKDNETPEQRQARLEKEKLRAAEDYKFSSTQVQLPSALANNLKAFGRSIPAFDLCDEEGGLEDDAHITVKYGIHTNDVAPIRKALATYVGPIRITLGKTGVFTGPSYDVLYVEVTSPDLVELNQRLADAVEVTNTHPVYTPHATVAYLKQGLGVRYAGNNALEGMSASIGSVRFSPAEGSYVDLPITGRDMSRGVFTRVDERAAEQSEDFELLKVLTAAIEAGDRDTIDKIIGKQVNG